MATVLEVVIDATPAEAGSQRVQHALQGVAREARASGEVAASAYAKVGEAFRRFAEDAQRFAAAQAQLNQARQSAQAELANLQQRANLLNAVRAGVLSLSDAERTLLETEIQEKTQNVQIAAALATRRQEV